MAKLIIFNQGTDLEFGECSECSAAIDPYGTLISKGEKMDMQMTCYPETCPYCHSKFVSRVLVKEE